MKHPLAERRPAAAARQGRQAAHVAPDAPPRRAPRHHLPVVRRPDADRGRPRRHARGLRAARDGAAHRPGEGHAALLRRRRRATSSIRCRMRSRKYRSAAYRARVEQLLATGALRRRRLRLPAAGRQPAGPAAVPGDPVHAQRRGGDLAAARRDAANPVARRCSTQQWQRMLRFERDALARFDLRAGRLGRGSARRSRGSTRAPRKLTKDRSRLHADACRTRRTLLADGRFDAVVCDFLPPVVNMPRHGAVPRDPASPTTWRRRSGGGTPRRRPTRSRGTCSTQQWQPHAALRARRARAVRSACSRSPRPTATRSRASIRARCAAPVHVVPDRRRHRSTSRPRPATPARRAHLVFTGSMDWLPNEDGMLYFVPRHPAAASAQAEPEATLSIIGRAPTPAVAQARRRARRRGHRPRGRRAAAHRARAPSTSCRCGSAAARG